jgi:hypothetical protein
MITQRIIHYKEYGRCAELSNGLIDVVVTLDCGPRIIRYGFLGEGNQLCDDAPLTVQIEGEPEEWRLMGGHRLWASPEHYPKTYYPDNDPVEYEWIQDGLRITKAAHPRVQIESRMEIRLYEGESQIRIAHTLKNTGEWEIETAVWALTNLKPGGLQVLPFARKESHFSDGAKGSRSLVLWTYARMDDPRIKWGNRYVLVQHEEGNTIQTKFGIQNTEGWAAYFRDDSLFIKRFEVCPGEPYPDGGISSATFLIEFMLEMESLSPIRHLKPGDEVRHIETWELHRNGYRVPFGDEDAVQEVVSQYIL